MSARIPSGDDRKMAGIDTLSNVHTMMLIRCRSGVDGRLSDRLGAFEGPSTLVFLHADGASLADRPPTGLDVARGTTFQVCRTSWRRRFPDRSPAPPFELSTLTRLIARIAAGVARIDSEGPGGACCSRRAGDGAYLLEIGFAPDGPRQAEEAIEWLLAAASLDLDVNVLFSADGLAHLRGDFARGWRQFIDFGLAGLYAETGRAAGPLDLDARRVAPVDAARLRADARQVIVL